MTCILLADDDPSIRAVLDRACQDWNYAIESFANGGDFLRRLEQEGGDVAIVDVMLPDCDGLEMVPAIKKRRPDLPIIVISAQNNVLTALRSGNRLVYDYLPKPFDLDHLRETIQRATPAASSVPVSEQALPLIGNSPTMQVVYRTLARLLSVDIPVLIQGESGTGKELAARIIHEYGNRHKKPFVALNMASMPRDLIESELFGHERGAFTGAHQTKPGQFALAEDGILFLDEIGDMPIEAQTRLLRVLQTGEYNPVGSTRTQRARCRIIAATHRNLSALIREGKFREDLYYRLAVLLVDLPPLRVRSEDIPALVAHFIAKAQSAGLGAKTFSPSALTALQAHSWPGNVRELENVIQRLLVLVPGSTIEKSHVAAFLRASALPVEDSLSRTVANLVRRYLADHDAAHPPRDLYATVLAEIEGPLLTLVLEATRGNQVKAAEMLGINRNTLRKKLREMQPGGTPHEI
ncbi:MAG TPA: sigma 54-interacting transcriptional regulator [Dongiaceae bacterium]|jgi:two-component system nitrogen regulation response regulator GlnG|nr:sigma 54-interacting transcriptional regulator [Dongiaceae bacterium]